MINKDFFLALDLLEKEGKIDKELSYCRGIQERVGRSASRQRSDRRTAQPYQDRRLPGSRRNRRGSRKGNFP